MKSENFQHYWWFVLKGWSTNRNSLLNVWMLNDWALLDAGIYYIFYIAGKLLCLHTYIAHQLTAKFRRLFNKLKYLLDTLHQLFTCVYFLMFSCHQWLYYWKVNTQLLHYPSFLKIHMHKELLKLINPVILIPRVKTTTFYSVSWYCRTNSTLHCCNL